MMTTDDLRALRHRLDMSQQAMADALGVHLRTWQAWEYEEAAPPPYLWRALEHVALECARRRP